MRLFIVVEGQTEEGMVNGLLKSHLEALGMWTTAVIVKTSPGHKGGGSKYSKWRKDIRDLLRSKREGLLVTTWFDLFRLPHDFPSYQQHNGIEDSVRLCELLELALKDDIDDGRFIPYIQRHEAETLVLASLPALQELLDNKNDRRNIDLLQKKISKIPPEDVNGGANTAPSKRLATAIADYEAQKPTYGPLAVESTGLATIRDKCPRFDAWVKTLETIAKVQSMRA